MAACPECVVKPQVEFGEHQDNADVYIQGWPRLVFEEQDGRLHQLEKPSGRAFSEDAPDHTRSIER